MVPAGFRFGVDRAGAFVVEHVVLRYPHVARQAVEQLVTLVQLVFQAGVGQQFVVGLVTFFRAFVEAAVVGAFTLDVHVGQACDEGPVRVDVPGVLGPDLLRWRHGETVATLHGVAVGIDDGAVGIWPGIHWLAVALERNERLGLALACALVPVTELQAVVAKVPGQLGGDTRTPGLRA